MVDPLQDPASTGLGRETSNDDGVRIDSDRCPGERGDGGVRNDLGRPGLGHHERGRGRTGRRGIPGRFHAELWSFRPADRVLVKVAADASLSWQRTWNGSEQFGRRRRRWFGLRDRGLEQRIL